MSASITARPWAWSAALMSLYVIGVLPSLRQAVPGLAVFLETAVAVFALARRIMSLLAALLALAAFLLNAHAWVYCTAALIEYPAAGAGVGFL